MTKKESQRPEDFPSEKDAKFAEKAAQAKHSKKAKSATESTKEQVEELNQEDLDEIVAEGQTELEKQLATAQAKADEFEDKYLRAEAEIQNMHTRHQKERASHEKYASQKLGTAILPVVDNLQRALAVPADDEAAQQLHKGVEMVLEHLQQALTENNITPVGKVGDQFDPQFHQAVQTAPADADHPADTIYQVLQTGYCLKDRTIRPAMVVVAK
nr:nucleotide exchange factor GrpE [Lapidilactobacillus wuchangensis]